MNQLAPHARISDAILRARQAGRVGLVPFMTAGYPDKDRFIATLKEVASAGDVVEVGVPFSDPLADGVTIQRSSHAAIEAGVSLRWILAQLSEAGDVGAPLVLMSYLNPLLAYGYEKLAEDAVAAGVCGFIVPDLPLEESPSPLFGNAAFAVRDPDGLLLVFGVPLPFLIPAAFLSSTAAGGVLVM